MLFALATLTLVAACSGTASHNKADVEFAQQMIPHHQQAVQMSRMAEKAAGPDVKALAKEIEDAQGPEITQMKGWLRDWDEPISADMHGMNGMNHDVPGMMTDREMQALRSTQGTAYDRRWLRMMIAHHRGAIDMAKTEIAHGEYPQAISLARTIAKAQAEEIKEMQEMAK